MPVNKKSVKKAAKKALVQAGGVQGLARRIDKLALKVASKDAGPVERVGRKVGGAFGFGGIGGAIGKVVGKIAGSGDYTFEGNMNSLFKPVRGLPTFSDNNMSSIRVKKAEYLQPVISSGSSGVFKNESISFNPGNPRLPWLSGSAALGYERYKVHGAAVVLVSAYSEVSTGTLGQWGVAFDYNLEDPPYASKMEAAQSEGAVFAKVSHDLMAGIECEQKQTGSMVKFIRFGPTETSSINATQTDHCTIQIMSQGISATSSYLGDAYLIYDIELFTQEINGGPQGNGAYNFHFANNVSISNANPLGTPQNGLVYGNIWCRVTNTNVYFPDWLQGEFFLEYVCQCATGSLTAPTISTFGNITSSTNFINTLAPAANIDATMVISGTSTNGVLTQRYITLKPASIPDGNYVGFNAVGITSAVNCTFKITQVPSKALLGVNQVPATPYPTTSWW